MCNIAETVVTGCFVADPTRGMYFWTAGQRIDPSLESTFVWRLTSTDTYSDRVSEMIYTNWGPNEPNYSTTHVCTSGAVVHTHGITTTAA